MEKNYFSFNQLGDLLNQIAFGIGIYDITDGSAVFFNDAYYNLVGYTKDEYSSEVDNERLLVYKKDFPAIEIAQSEFERSGKVSSTEYRIIKKGGKSVWITLNASTIIVGNKKYALASFDDSTNKNEISSFLNIITENIVGSVSVHLVKNNKSTLVYANNQFYKLVGVDKATYDHNQLDINRAFVTERDRKRIESTVDNSLRTGIPGVIEHQCIRQDGTVGWLRRRYAAIKQGSDSYFLLSVVTDISELKEEEVQASLDHGRFKLVVDELKAGIFEWNLKTGGFYCSRAFYTYAISEADPEEIINMLGTDSDMVHPDDRAAIEKFCIDADASSGRAEAILRLKMKDGSYRWSRLIVISYRGEDREPSRTVGIIIDINEEHERAFMFDRLLNEMPGGVVSFKVVGDEIECLFFSDGFEKLTGRSRMESEAFIRSGNILKKITAPSDYDRVIKELAASVEQKLPININFFYNCKSGTSKWLHASATQMQEDNGCPVYYCILTNPSNETELYRRISDGSANGVCVIDVKTKRVLYRNDALLYIFNNSEAVKKPFVNEKEIIRDEYLLLTEKQLSSLDETLYAEFHVFKGKKQYLGIRARKMNWNGIDAAIMYIIDETKEHDRQLRLQTLIDKIPGGIAIFDLSDDEAHQVYMNDGFYTMVHDTREARDKRTDCTFRNGIVTEDLKVIDKAVKHLLHNDDNEAGFSYRLIDGNGEKMWVHLEASVVKRHSNKITVYCNIIDYSEVMAAREALEKANVAIKQEFKKEIERRKILEKDCFVNISINISSEMVTSINCIDNRYSYLPKEFDCKTAVREMCKNIPDDKDKRAVYNLMDCSHAVDLWKKGITEESLEYQSYQPDGKLHWVQVVCNIAEDIVTKEIIAYAYYYDIDEEKKTQLANESVIEEEIDYVIICNSETGMSKFVKVKPGLRDHEELSRFDISQILKSVLYKTVVLQDRKSVSMFFNLENLKIELAKEPVFTITYRETNPDGSVSRKKARAFYLDNTHDDIVIARRDITDLYEEEQHQKEVLQNAADEAIKANNAKSEFLARMSHDMRTPMNGILGLAAIMSESDNINEIKNDLNQLKMSGQYLLRLINDTLDMSKIEAGKCELHLQPIDSELVLKSILGNAQIITKNKGVNLEIIVPQIKHGEWVPVLADSARLEQIIMNIISNSVKFTPKGGTVTLKMETVSVENDVVTDRYTISDNGIGMSEDFVPHLFDAFSQEGRINTDRESGTGLGMSIVKQLVAKMNGEISVTSKINEGTTVTILIRYPMYHGEMHKTMQNDNDYSRLDGKQILLCEDHPLNAQIVIRILSKLGMIVKRAENGRIGTDMFKNSAKGYYDAVLMDIRMPEMNGLEAAAAIRSLDRDDAKTIPIIAMTANAYDEDVRMSIESGMNEHLAKPIEPKKLYSTLLNYIK